MSFAGGAIALFFAFQQDYEKAFVAAAAGAVCWFISYRQKLRQSMPKEEYEDEDTDEEVRP